METCRRTPFDIRSITVGDNVIPELAISVVTENTGGVVQDLVLTWNLTRTDTSSQLSAGADTFAVNPYSTRTWTVYPSTSYVGDVMFIEVVKSTAE